jgi:AcrR family transcriptional regulator
MASTDSASKATKPLFPQLSSGRHRLPPAEVARHQKARLEGAMVEAVARHGFAGTTLSELVTLAGVSKTTFYQHFENKQDCFLAAFDAIIAEVTKRVGATFREPGDFRERLTAALQTFMEIAAAEPAAASFTTVDSLTLGKDGVAHRERGAEDFQVMVRQSFDHSPSEVEVSDRTVRAIVAGIRGVVYRRLRADEADRLPELVDELVEWALSYQRRPGKTVQRALTAAGRDSGHEEAREREEEISWEEPSDSPRSRHALTQRQRIVRGAARVVVERGYDALSIPAISGAAGVSNQTFYEHFQSKRDAFLAAFQIMTEDVLRVAGAAFAAEGDRPEAVGAGLRALLSYVAEHELYARLAFFELPTAGPVALDQADRILDGFTAFLKPGTAPAELVGIGSAATLQAIATGIWESIQYEIVHGRRRSLAELAPEVAWIALAPLNAAGPAELSRR